MANFEMQTIQMTKEEMLTRMVRFKDLKPAKVAFLDTVLPGYEREAFNVIGRGVTENSEVGAAIPADGGFNVTYIRNKPGARGALHAHPTLEVFIPITGKWAVIWNDGNDFGKSENEMVLEQGDCIAVPPGVMRCFKNVGDEEALLLVIFGLERDSNDGGKVMWPKHVYEDAAKFGLGRDETGNLVNK